MLKKIIIKIYYCLLKYAFLLKKIFIFYKEFIYKILHINYLFFK
ncbi:hypothetical protein CWS_02000 [Buchnera aphidicola str. JF99 (Acyrthosiphon pisum)]|nr:hypothetical protein CWO_02005 [Buchnera aphidicola str. LL01 (Acyrthosiphon pisum)]ADP66771.1 hypothetical protein CWQ_02050 [Buchnera aphidicola str. TLW03 (Acyrthosiphon pisum)]ADP67355.1 hypothetical protein CWS_02000 [Buchnera aphidicola str. JF99 (Acyrthosiphon pisum)]